VTTNRRFMNVVFYIRYAAGNDKHAGVNICMYKGNLWGPGVA
jgi:hypothetical protein